MSRLRDLSLAALLGAALLAGTPVATADEGAGPADILELFDQFVSSGAAASRCAEPSDALALRFLSNFQWVSAYASREISTRRPTASPQEVAEELATRSLTIKTNTHSLVKDQGCASEAVQVLVRRFLAQTAWRPESA